MAVHPPLRVLFSAVNQARYHDLLRLRLDRVLMLYPLQRGAHLVRRGVRFQQFRHGLFDLLARRPVDLREMLVQLDAQEKPVVLHWAVLLEEGFAQPAVFADLHGGLLRQGQVREEIIPRFRVSNLHFRCSFPSLAPIAFPYLYDTPKRPVLQIFRGGQTGSAALCFWPCAQWEPAQRG